MQLGKQIKTCREAKNISQQELANRLKYLNQSQVSKIEQGSRRVTVQDLMAISQALGVDASDLTPCGK
jgi:transcriptional regulator with XRE-family HTH domain